MATTRAISWARINSSRVTGRRCLRIEVTVSLIPPYCRPRSPWNTPLSQWKYWRNTDLSSRYLCLNASFWAGLESGGRIEVTGSPGNSFVNEKVAADTATSTRIRRGIFFTMYKGPPPTGADATSRRCCDVGRAGRRPHARRWRPAQQSHLREKDAEE